MSDATHLLETWAPWLGIGAFLLPLLVAAAALALRRTPPPAPVDHTPPRAAAPAPPALEDAAPLPRAPAETAPRPAPEPAAPAPPETLEPAPLPRRAAAPEPAAEPEATPAPVEIPEPEATPAPVEIPEPRPLRERLARTRDALVGRVASLVGTRSVDEEVLEELEALLFTADLGVKTAQGLLDEVRRDAQGADAEKLRSVLHDALERRLLKVEPQQPSLALLGKPHVILVLGVNGSGKTTTIGKLAARHVAAGHSVVLGAGDTFRAAAIEQLQAWGERVGCPVIAGSSGGDPAAIAFDTVKAAVARGADVAIIDTAGRLQTRQPLMDELAKIARVIGRDLEGAPHETLLVLDANTGQNALSQGRLFTEAAPVTGIVLTKLDGTAKGGVIVGLAEELGIPVRHVGVGEGIEDLRDFHAREFVDALFAEG